MPLIWRYILKTYFQIFILCITSFITALFVMRFRDIAEFATLSSDGLAIFLFSLYQLPYILPEAIPVSCVIAAMITLQKMSYHQELTTLRAVGISLKALLFPILAAGTLLSLVNLTMVAEIAPACRFLAKELSYKMTAANPFYIFNKITEGKLVNAYVEMHQLKGGKKAEGVFLILNNRRQGRLDLMTAAELTIEQGSLKGKNITIISSINSGNDQTFDHLVIENQETMTTAASSLSYLLQDAHWHLGVNYLPLKMLFVPSSNAKKSLLLSAEGLEIARRLSLAFTPLLFTFLGAAFGMEIGRNRTKRSILWSVLLSALYLSAFIGAKSMKHFPKTAWILYFIPYPIIFVLSLLSLGKISRGVE